MVQFAGLCAKFSAEAARSLLVTEQLPALVREQATAISNLEDGKITVWDSGKNGAGGKTSTADFVSSLLGSLPPLHELAADVGIKLPAFTGEVKPEAPASAKSAGEKMA